MSGATRRRRGGGRGRRVVRFLLLAVLSFYAACAVGLVYLRFAPPIVTAVQLQRMLENLFSGRVVWRQMDWQPLDRISPHLPRAVIAAEDARFFEHHGIDVAGLREAMRDNLRRGRFWRGGSTITQQLVKNLFLTTYGSFARKALELPLALLAEMLLSKRRILELYVNVVEWGPDVYGAEVAALYHYRTPAAALDRNQSARLAACLPSPLRRTPQRMGGYARVIERRMQVLKNVDGR